MTELRMRSYRQFQSTLPAWGETADEAALAKYGRFQSTLPAWGETKLPPLQKPPKEISIHSPRMGRDREALAWPGTPAYFNPLSPHGERRGGA